ncbi:MAG TPA: DUF1256 domain-containing protein [Pseudoneobacillus sp.]|nr:DUF1256 domain-containing protein [Pseudoneobacillus sp.]
MKFTFRRKYKGCQYMCGDGKIAILHGENCNNYKKDALKMLENVIKVGEPYRIICAGTMKVSGDSVSPRVGTLLKKAGLENVIGCMEDQIHALNDIEKLKDIDRNIKTILVIGMRCDLPKDSYDFGLYTKNGTSVIGRGVHPEKEEVCIGNVSMGICVGDIFKINGVKQEAVDNRVKILVDVLKEFDTRHRGIQQITMDI